MTRVKICGLTRLEDAEAALNLGADALGFIFAKSPRRIEVDKARKIISALGPWTFAVGVFVNESPDTILRTVDRCRLAAVQLHGDEKPEMTRKLKGLKIIKAFRIGTDTDLSKVNPFPADAYLFDTKVSGQYGGTGKQFDWRILSHCKFKSPVIVSGGLNAKNVREAVKSAHPYGVDTSSGVETAPGLKNIKLMRDFIRHAQEA